MRIGGLFDFVLGCDLLLFLLFGLGDAKFVMMIGCRAPSSFFNLVSVILVNIQNPILFLLCVHDISSS